MCMSYKIFCFISFRFVSYGTVREADSALQKLNGHDMGNGLKLSVKVSESNQSKQNRLAKKREDDKFLNTLNCAKYGSGGSVAGRVGTEEVESYEMTEKEAEGSSENPFLEKNPADAAHPVLPHGDAVGVHSPAKASAEGKLTPAAASPSDGAEFSPSESCVVCAAPCKSKCTRCKTPYCGKDCQFKDWQQHRLICNRKKDDVSKETVKAVSPNKGPTENALSTPSRKECDESVEHLFNTKGPLQIADGEEEEGFETIVPDDPDIETLVSFVQNSLGYYGPVVAPGTPAAACVVQPASGSALALLLKEILKFYSNHVRPLSSIPLNSPLPELFTAFIVSVRDTSTLHAVVLSAESKLAFSKLGQLSQKYSLVPVNPKELTTGSCCGLLLSEKELFRVKLTEFNSGGKATVFAQDVGEYATVTFDKLVTLPESYIFLPNLCVQLSLADVPTACSSEEKSLQLLKDAILFKPVHVTHHKTNKKSKLPLKSIHCDVHTLDGAGFKDILEKQPIQKPVQKPVSPITVPSCKDDTPALKSAIPPPRTVHLASKVEFHQPPRTGMFSIFPKVVISPSVIWAQVNHPHIKTLHLMQKDLNEYCKTQPKDPSYVPSVGEMIAAKCAKEEHAFCRAEVLSINPNCTLDVHFVDYGYKENVGIDQSMYLSPIFLSLPKQALKFATSSHCLLASLTSLLREKIVNKEITVEFVSQGFIKIYDPELRGSDLLEKLAKFVPKGDVPTSSSSLDIKLDGSKIILLTCKKERKLQFAKLLDDKPQQAVVSHVNDPYYFFIQILGEDLEKLQALSEKLNQIPLTCLSKPKVGDLCVCRYSEDNCFHRAKVLSVSDNAASIQYIDYGNTASVDITELYRLDEEFQTVPAQALLCTINSLLNPLGKSERWSKDTIKEFKLLIEGNQILVVTVKKMVGTKHIVDVKLPSNQNLIDVFVERGLGTTAASFNNKSPRKVPTVQKPEDAVPVIKKPLPSIAPRSASCDTSAVENKVDSNVGKLLQVHSSIELDTVDIPKNKFFEVIVSEVKSPSSFFLQLASPSSVECLSMLSVELNEAMSSCNATTCTIDVGCICAAKFSDDSWYRARVIEASSTRYLVYFVDFGNTDFVSCDRVALCPERFSQPAQAIECCLDGIKPLSDQWTPQSTALLKELVMDKILSAKVVSDSPSLSVDLVDTSSSADVNIAAELVAKGHAIQQLRCEKSCIDGPQVDTLTLPNDKFLDVLISEVKSPSCIFLQLASKSSAECFSTLCVELNEAMSSSKPPVSTFEVGCICAAKFSDDSWYRARVVEASSTGYLVYFVDFGNTDFVSCDRVALCPERFSQPAQAIECSLDGIKPLSGQWTPQSTALLKELVMDKIISAKVVSDSPSLSVDLVDTSSSADVNIAAELVAKGHAIQQLRCEKSRIDGPQVDTLTLPNDKFLDVLVSEVKSPSCIFLQLASKSSAECLSTLCVELNEAMSSSKPPVSTFEVGCICAAKFSDDSWYRARVVEASSTGYLVYFIDFGNTDFVSCDRVALCPERFSQPAQAIECSLDGIEPLSDQWTPQSTALLKKLVMDKILSAKVVSDSPLLSVDLVDTSSSADVNIAAELVAKGHAANSASSQPVSSGPQIESLSLPTDKFVEIIVSEVKSPSSFFLQLASPSSVECLSMLSVELNEAMSSCNATTCTIDVGRICAAKFSDDSWYRARVIEASSTRYLVYFVDFGNTDFVSCDRVALCPERFSQPAQAIECSLDGIEPLSDQWTPRSTALLKELTGYKILLAKVVSNDTLPSVDLVDTSSTVDVNLAAELVAKGHAANSASSQPVSSGPQIESLSLPTDKFVEIIVSEVKSPSSFFLQLASPSSVECLSMLSVELNEAMSSSKPPVSTFEVGCICAAKFMDDSWYRARVVEASSTGYLVYFVDFGNTDFVSCDRVALCPERFSQPAQAIECCLDGIKPLSGQWTPQSTALLKELTSDKILLAEVVSNDTLPSVDLVGTSSTVDVNLAAELVAKGHAAVVTPCTLDDSKSLPSKTQNLLPVGKPIAVMKKLTHSLAIPPATLSIENFNVVVVHVQSLGEVYLQVYDTKAIEEALDMMNKITSYCSQAEGFVTDPTPGDLCLAEYQEEWFRARLKEQVGTSEYKVTFFDYGNTETVSSTAMKPFPPQFLSAPEQVIRCALFGVSPQEVIEPTVSATNCMKTVLTSDGYSCHVISRHPLLVDLKPLSNPSCVSVRNELIHSGIMAHIEPMSLKVDSLSTDSAVVLVTEVHSPADFWLQCCDADGVLQFKKLSEELGIFCENSAAVDVSTLVLGKLCCARFSDGMWYRARVVDFRGVQEVEVFFVDYGNSFWTTPSELCPIKGSFVAFPCMAIHCCLVEFEEAHEFKREVVNSFRGLVENRHLVARKVSTTGVFKSVVELVDTSSAEDVYIHTLL